jgi:hypothetical protein
VKKSPAPRYPYTDAAAPVITALSRNPGSDHPGEPAARRLARPYDAPNIAPDEQSVVTCPQLSGVPLGDSST